MFKIIALIVSLFYTNSVFACTVPVTPLNAGDQAPCTGFLFSPEKELELRTQNEDYKLMQEQIKVYLQQKELYQQQLKEEQVISEKEAKKAEIWRKSAEDTTAKYVKAEENRGLRDWIFLLAGVALTVGAGYAVGQASGHK